MEMTVFVAALGIVTLWIVGETRGEHYRMGRAATTMVVVCAVALQVYCLRPAIRTDPLYLPWPLVVTIKLLVPYLTLLQVTRGQRSAPIRANAPATLLLLPDKLPHQLEEQVQRKLLVCSLSLTKYGH
jgi:hypothetical protein